MTLRGWLVGLRSGGACNAYRQGQSFRLFLPFGQRHRGFENPRLFKDRPADGKRSGMRIFMLVVAED